MDIRDIRKSAFALLAVMPLAVACAPDSPQTQLHWDVNTRTAAHHSPRREAPRHVAVKDNDDKAPTPKPRPAYQQASYQPPAKSNSNLTFDWPVTGTIISRFGSTTGGERNDGINIATTQDAPIHASASGTVTYSGNELKGYGNLLLIKHADGYVTAYAHADRILVEKGAFVQKGQVIGYSGSTGDVTSPQLHFEIRHDTAPVNPANLLISRAS